MTNKQIPANLMPEFTAYMDAHNDDELPDGAWFSVLEDAAERFIADKKLRGIDANDATHQYLWSVG